MRVLSEEMCNVMYRQRGQSDDGLYERSTMGSTKRMVINLFLIRSGCDAVLYLVVHLMY